MPDQTDPAAPAAAPPPAAKPAPAAPQPAPEPVETTPGRFMVRNPFGGLPLHAILSDPPAAMVDIYGRSLSRIADEHWKPEHREAADKMNPLAVKEG